MIIGPPERVRRSRRSETACSMAPSPRRSISTPASMRTVVCCLLLLLAAASSVGVRCVGDGDAEAEAFGSEFENVFGHLLQRVASSQATSSHSYYPSGEPRPPQSASGQQQAAAGGRERTLLTRSLRRRELPPAALGAAQGPVRQPHPVQRPRLPRGCGHQGSPARARHQQLCVPGCGLRAAGGAQAGVWC
jgi:hypothetical protein